MGVWKQNHSLRSVFDPLRKIERIFTVVIVKLSTFEAEPSVDPEGPAVVKVRKSSLNVHISEKETYYNQEIGHKWSYLPAEHLFTVQLIAVVDP